MTERGGMWWISIFGMQIILRSPRSRPLFSERAGYDPPLLACRGWRLHIRGERKI